MGRQVINPRWISLLFVLLSLAAGYSLLQQASTPQGWFLPRRLIFAFLLVGAGLVIGFLQFSLLNLKKLYFLQRLREKLSCYGWKKWLGAFLIACVLSGMAFLVYGPYGQPFLDPLVRFWLFAYAVWLVSLLLAVSGLTQDQTLQAVTALLLVGLGFNVGYFLSRISTHPFSLDWSETSRYYYASLYFAKRIYGIETAWSPLHPSRYLLQSIPFLRHPLPLWFHRLWQVLLWICIPAATSWLLVRRLQLPRYRLLVGLYGYLFLMIGAVYYHLLVIPALILAFCPTHVSEKRANLLGWVALVTASIWAGISRVNWLPMPAVLFATLYLLERPIKGQKLWRYIMTPFGFSAISILMAFFSSAAYIRLSGNPPTYFASSFTSDLIWQRLLPNPTYYTGILLPILFVSVPTVGLIIYAKRSLKITLSRLRILGLVCILSALFVVGVIVSAKIGGGSNLHNFDGYLVVLWILLLYFLSGKVSSEKLDKEQPILPILEILNSGKDGLNGWQNRALNTLLIWLVVAPLPFVIFQGRPFKTYLPDRIEEALDALYSVVEKAAANNREVLLITERHLLTFGYLPNVPLVADYEKVWLMEMAMANHRDYLKRFYTDLAKRRFAVIVTTQTYISPQGDLGRFGDENRAWRKRVNRPILCYYKPYLRFREFNFEILLPREQVQRRCR